MVNILHTSDLHGQYKVALKALATDGYDLWIDTGDFFPNKTRGERAIEVRHQTKWFGFKNLGERIVKALNGRPLISVGGNHDYVCLAALVRDAGGEAYDLSDGPVNTNGLTFAGCREVPWIAGEWNGETFGPDFTSIVEGVFASDPDVLVTHAPAAGILDDKAHGGGIAQITSTLTWQNHKVCAHFFGHIHETQGSVSEMGIQFINGSGKALIHSF